MDREQIVEKLLRIDEDVTFDYFSPCQEDLAVMKLYRWEEPDIADLTSETFLRSLDWDLLDRLVYNPEEAAASRSAKPEADLGLKQMRFNYEEYRRRWRR